MRSNIVKQCLGLKPKWSTSDMHAYLPLKGISHEKIDEFIETTSPTTLARLLSMDFNDTILWKELTEEETAYWNRVSSWVRWFRTTYAYIENAYKISKDVGKNIDDIKVMIIQKFLYQLMPTDADDENTKQAKYNYVDSLVNYLIESFDDQCIFQYRRKWSCSTKFEAFAHN